MVRPSLRSMVVSPRARVTALRNLNRDVRDLFERRRRLMPARSERRF